MAARRGKAKAEEFPIDEHERLAVETELRNALAGRELELSAAILARVVGGETRGERRELDALYQQASASLADPRGLTRRITSLDPLGQTALALLCAHRSEHHLHEPKRDGWWSRTALIQALALAHPGEAQKSDELLGKALADLLTKTPVLVRLNPWTRGEELSLFSPLTHRLAPLVRDVLAIGTRPAAEHEVTPRAPEATGLGTTLLALAIYPGVVAHRRPRVTRNGDLHGADATKLERVVADARGLHATWAELLAFEDVEGALMPRASRVRALLDDPSGLVASFLRARLGRLGYALACLSAQATPRTELELGRCLLALHLSAKVLVGFDLASILAWIEKGTGSTLAPLVHADVNQNLLMIPADVRAALRGEPLTLREAATGFVQPNYEILMPPGVPLGAAFVVSCAAELLHFESVARLRLTRESVMAARSLGISADAIIEALGRITGDRALPASVRHAIAEWGESVGEARVRSISLLELQASAAATAKAADLLAPILIDQPSPGMFLLHRAPDSRELAALRAFGIAVRSAAAAPMDEREVEPEGELPQFPHRAMDDSTDDGSDAIESLREATSAERLVANIDASRPNRKIPEPEKAPSVSSPVDQALEIRREEWAHRTDWLSTLERFTGSATFVRAIRSLPGPVALAIRRASDPARLELEIARLLAESSIRAARDD